MLEKIKNFIVSNQKYLMMVVYGFAIIAVVMLAGQFLKGALSIALVVGAVWLIYDLKEKIKSKK